MINVQTGLFSDSLREVLLNERKGESMKQVAFMGLGAMGSRMVKHLLPKYKVSVYNRSMTEEQKIQWESLGVKVFPTPSRAVEGCDVVLSMVRDDKASEDVWFDPQNGALSTLEKQAIAVECSTLSVAHIRKLNELFTQEQRRCLVAPVAGSRPQAEQQKIAFLVGGDKATFEDVEEVLSAMSPNVLHCGSLEAAMVMKLAVNTFLVGKWFCCPKFSIRSNTQSWVQRLLFL